MSEFDLRSAAEPLHNKPQMNSSKNLKDSTDTVVTARHTAVKVVKCSEEPRENLWITWTKLATHTTLVTGV